MTNKPFQFRVSKRNDALLMEGYYKRRDGIVQVRAVVPLEKARAAFRDLEGGKRIDLSGACASAGLRPDHYLAARAAAGMVGDAAEVAGFSLKKLVKKANPFRRKKKGGGAQRSSKDKDEGSEEGGGEEGGADDAPPSDKPAGAQVDDAALDAQVAQSDAANASKGADVMGSEEGFDDYEADHEPELLDEPYDYPSVSGLGLPGGALRVAAAAGVPGAGPTLAVQQATKGRNPGVSKAAGRLAQARAGNPRAKAIIKKVKRDAKAGDPASQKALKDLHTANHLAAKVAKARRSFYDSGVT